MGKIDKIRGMGKEGEEEGRGGEEMLGKHSPLICAAMLLGIAPCINTHTHTHTHTHTQTSD